jgi:hypothetical protein
MIPGIISNGQFPAVLRGGPRDGEERYVSVVGNVPCERILYPDCEYKWTRMVDVEKRALVYVIMEKESEKRPAKIPPLGS